MLWADPIASRLWVACCKAPSTGIVSLRIAPLQPNTEPIALILGAQPFPYGNASANRMLTMAMTWRAAGWRPIVINDHPQLVENEEPRVVRGIEYVNIGDSGQTRLQRFSRRRAFPARALSALALLNRARPPEYVVVPAMLFTPRLRRMGRRMAPNSQFVVDVVERHDARQFSTRVLHPYYLRHRLTWWYTRRRADHVIVISTALAEVALGHRQPLVLPACVDVEEFRDVFDQVRPTNLVRVAYFGSPGAKDDLATLVKALALVPSDLRDSLIVSMAGLNRGQLESLPRVGKQAVADVESHLDIRGRLSRPDVLHLLGESHFSFLVRSPRAGFARYGFPTKISESLAAGCPPIGNLTSDLDKYLVDGQNALLCGDASPGAVAQALVRALGTVEEGTYASLRRAALDTAIADLSPEAWALRLRSWTTR